MMAQIRFIEKQIDELEVGIPKLLHKINSVITTFIGIGDVLVGEIEDISRFDSAPKLVAFAGLVKFCIDGNLLYILVKIFN